MLYVITTKRLLLSVEGTNDEGRKFKQVHKVDEPHQRSRLKFTTWTDPTKVKEFKQVHKVDGPYQGSRLKFTTWMDPTRVKELKQVHEMDGPHEGSRP